MEQRDFKGVWISKEVWLDKRLNAIDKIILTEVDSLDNEEHCTASNEYLAEFCQCSEKTVSRSISKLVELEYIKILKFNGRIRTMTTSVSRQPRQNVQADQTKCPPINIDNKLNTLKESKKEKFDAPTYEEVEEYARSKNRVDLARPFYDYFTEGNWKDSKGNKVKNWKQKMITWISHDSYKPNFSTGRQYSKEELNSYFLTEEEIENLSFD